jgi:hypothetical protein
MIIANIIGIGNIKSATIREKRIIVMHKEMAYALVIHIPCVLPI